VIKPRYFSEKEEPRQKVKKEKAEAVDSIQ